MKKVITYLKNLFSFGRRAEIEEIINWDMPTTCDNVESRFELLQEAYRNQLSSEEEDPDVDMTRPLEEVYGNYSVEGHNVGNREQNYFGELELNELHEKLYKASWKIGFGGQLQKGMGFLSGDKLALDFYYTEEGKRYYGLVIYQVVSNSVLHGYWIEPGVEGVGFEECNLKNCL
ncbi:MAG: hypothetical protein ACEPOZ_17510 [Marinifilaceae bacterium]